MANRFQSRNCNRLSCGAKPQEENLAPNCAYLRRLQAIDFALADLILYLNAYPHSAEALAYYHELREERKQLLSTAPQGTFPALTAMDNHTPNQWTWVLGPWPWENEANC